MRIRPARPGEAEALRGIERAAGECFRDVGMPEIADDEPPPVVVLEAYRQAGRCLVATDAADRPIAYVLTDAVDAAAHVEQISVHPDHARRGVGRALLDHVGGDTALTLTTFADVPWNAPYYARLGFRVLTADELTPGLHALREREAAHGLDRWPRVCMRRDRPTVLA